MRNRKTYSTGLWKAAWLCLLGGGAVLLLFATAYAQVPGLYETTGLLGQCLTAAPVDGVILTKMAGCFRLAIEQLTNTYLLAIVPYATPIVGALITLAITLYGVKISIFAFSYLHAETMIFLLKIGFILTFALGMGTWAGDFFDMTGSLVDMVANGISGGGSTIFCPATLALPAADRVWGWLDCYLERLIGYGGHDFKSGLVALLWPIALSGGTGVAAAFFGAGAIILFVYLVVMALFQVMMAYLTLAVMLIFTPILFPLIMFRSTFRYFNGWFAMLMTGMLTPMFVVGFLTFFVSVTDHIMYQGIQYGPPPLIPLPGGVIAPTYPTIDSIFGVVPGTSPDELAKNVQKVLRENQMLFSLKMKTDPTEGVAHRGGAVVALWNFLKNPGAHIYNGLIDQALDGGELALPYTVLDFSSLDDTPGATNSRMRQLCYIFGAIFLTAAVAVSFLGLIPKMVDDITGGGMAVVAMGMQGAFGKGMFEKAKKVQ